MVDSVMFTLLLLSLLASVNGIYVYRDNDWAALTFTERGIIQNYVKCEPEIKDKCVVDPKQVKSPYTQSILAYAIATVDIVKKNPKFHEKARIAVLGMGPATMGRFWNHFFPNMEIDYIEINQDLVDAVNNTLPFPASKNFRVIVSDGLKFVKDQMALPAAKQKEYDIIVHDAYDSVGPVASLNTLAFYNGLKKLLESSGENGVLISNFWVLNVTFAREIALKYKEVFGNVRVVGVPYTPSEEANCAIIAHSMTRKDDMVCTDKGCKSKRSKSSRSKVSPICQDIKEYVDLGREISIENNIAMDLGPILQESWNRRPFRDDPEFC